MLLFVSYFTFICRYITMQSDILKVPEKFYYKEPVFMLVYDLNEKGKKSKYEYLYQCLKNDILSGKLAEGQKMPSKRQLAEANHISVRTVMNAYEQLMVEGYLESRERSGYYVVSNFSSQLRYQKATIPLTSREKEENWIADFTANTTVYERFPFSMWTKVMRQVLGDYNLNLMKRGDFLGSPELRYEIAKYLYYNRGIMVSPDCIVIGTGIEYLYYRLISLLPEDSVYAVENPGYRKIRHIYEGLNVKWASISMARDGINMSSLRESGASVVHTSPEHHYPLGTVMSARRRQELLKWLEESSRHYIIEDDYDCEFRYTGHMIPALYGLDSSNKVIYMNTFSKTLSPGIRIAYMVLPPQLLETYVNSANFYSNTSSNLEQYTLAAFLRDGYYDRHLNRMRRYYISQGEKLKKTLQTTGNLPIEEIYGMRTGTHLLVRLNTTLSDEEIKEKARKKGINLCCLSEFCVDEKELYSHTLVLNYSSLNEDRMQEVVGILGEIF